MKLKFDKEPDKSGFSVGKVAGARGIKYRTTFAKGGAVSPMCEGCPNPAACKKAGKCLMAEKKMAKGGDVKGKKPGAAVAIMIAMPAKGKGKTKMNMGGMCGSKKK